MTHYRCIRCGAEGEDILKLNHAIGLAIGRPCAGGKNAPLEETGKKVKTETTSEIPQPKKSKGHK